MRTLVLLCLLLSACSPPAMADPPPSLGQEMPAFELPDPDGGRIRSVDLRGGWTVVELIRSGDW